MTGFTYRVFALIFLLFMVIELTCAGKVITAPPGISWYLLPEIPRSSPRLYPRLYRDQDRNIRVEIKFYRRAGSSWTYGTSVVCLYYQLS